MELVGALAIGFTAGIVAGMLGVGGGVPFVPGLVLVFGLTLVEAEGTSLAAMVPVALAGAWRQHGYGNLRLRDGVLMGLLASGGAVLGVVLVNRLPGRAVELAFAALMVFIAAQLVRRPAPA